MDFLNCSIKFSIYICFLMNVNLCHGGIYDWIFGDYSESNFGNKHQDIDSSALSAKIPFEMTNEDEKFVRSIVEYASVSSNLDICHHKVIISLKKSCSKLTEEDLAKTAVNLLNCQSLVEGRAIYPCNSEMSLQACTRDMDQDTWNAYHIVSNRVRAVCYHFRQRQFTAKTEMTVNKLLTSAEEQIEGLKLIEESQQRLKATTSGVLEQISSGHDSLRKQQEGLASANAQLHGFVTSNVRELYREKRLIASGQRELAQISLSIKQKLEEAQNQLAAHGSGQRDTHRKIIQDLAHIQDSARVVWAQIEESTRKILASHEETVSQYGLLLADLRKMNATVRSLAGLLETVKDGVEEKFSWISALLGGTDATVRKIYCFILHSVFCLLGMIASTFLQVPYATRVALIVLVPVNAAVEIHAGASLRLSTVAAALLGCALLNVGTVYAVGLQRRRRESNEKRRLHPLPASPIRTQAPNQTPTRPSPDHRDHILADQSFELPSSPASFEESQCSVFQRLNGSGVVSESSLLGQTIEEEPLDDSHPTDVSSTLECTPAKNFSRNRIVGRRAPESPSRTLSRSLLTSFRRGPVSPLANRTFSGVFEEAESSGQWPGKKTCGARCRSGQRCRNAVSGAAISPFCHRHAGGISRDSTPVPP